MNESSHTHTEFFHNQENFTEKISRESLSLNPNQRIEDKKEMKQFRITKIDYSKRNLELIKKLEEKKLQRHKEIEDENLKKEKNKEVLKYVTLYKVKNIKMHGIIEPSSIQKKAIYNIDKSQINQFFKSRYASLIRNLPRQVNKNQEECVEIKSKSQDKKSCFSRERDKENENSCKNKGKSESKVRNFVDKKISNFSNELNEKNKLYIQKIIQDKEEVKKREEQKQKQKEQVSITSCCMLLN